MRTPAAFTAAAVLLALAAAPAAQAQPVSEPSGPDTYLTFSLGGFVPGGDLKDLVDPGLGLALTFGAKVNKYVGVEATAGWSTAAGTTTLAGSSFKVDAAFQDIPILASVRFVAPLDAVELSARAGVGAHLTSLHAKEPGGFSSWQTDTAFGWHAGAAAALQVSRTMLVGADVLATFASAKYGTASTAIDGVQVSVTLGYRL